MQKMIKGTILTVRGTGLPYPHIITNSLLTFSNAGYPFRAPEEGMEASTIPPCSSVKSLPIGKSLPHQSPSQIQ